MSAPLDLSALLPLRYIQVSLTFSRATQFPFLHRYIVAGFLRHLLDSPKDFSVYLRLDVVENAHRHYQKNDLYHFAVLSLPGGEGLLEKLINKLSALPESAPFANSNKTLSDNVSLSAITNVLSQTPIQCVSDSEPITYQQFTSMVAQSNWSGYLDVNWLTPIRVKKENVGSTKGEARFCADADDLSAPKFFYHVYNTLANLLNQCVDKDAVLAITPAVRWHKQHCFWVNHYAKNTRQTPVHCGGMLGQNTLYSSQKLSDFWQQCLFLAQFIGIGNFSSFGWGRYQISAILPRVKPAQSLLNRAMMMDNLNQALAHCQTKLSAEQKANVTLPDLDVLRQDIVSNRYQAQPLQAWSKTKSDGSLRGMATPNFSERVLQRAVSQIITPILDQFFYQHSYGYRRCKGRQDVMKLIQQEYKNGYRFVFESDVDDFFDVITWERVACRLNSLFTDDAVITLIMQWLKADMVYHNRLIKRSRGLPQGAPISPILANLLLDDFDQDMQKHGFKLIRYADDFIVLAKDKDTVEKALEVAQKSLKEHGLELHPDKTQITHQDKGYQYLGYLFLSDQVFPIKPDTALPLHSQALAKSALMRDTPLQTINEFHQQLSTTVETAPAKHSAQTTAVKGSFIIVSGEFVKLTTLDNNLQISQADELLQSVSWQQIQAILIIGRHHISTPVLYSAMSKSIPIYFVNTYGRYQGELNAGSHLSEHKDLWLKQHHYFADQDKALVMAKAIVDAKAHSQLVVLRQKKKQLSEISSINKLLKNINNAQTLPELNGIEGKISAYYFQAIKAILPSQWEFKGRNRRPVKDPFNLLLSLGYSSLYAYTQSLLTVSGLYPYVGFYHQPRGKHAVLASDLLEPFRYIVERIAMRSVALGKIKPQDFKWDNQKLVMDNAARKQYLSDLFSRFNTPFIAKGGREPYDVFQHLYRQNQRLIAAIYDTERQFEPFSVK